MWTVQENANKPVLAETAESTGTGVAAEKGTLEGASALTIKPSGGENWAGPASRRRDNIGAPAVQACADKALFHPKHT